MRRRTQKKRAARKRRESRWLYVHCRGCVTCDPAVCREVASEWRIKNRHLERRVPEKDVSIERARFVDHDGNVSESIRIGFGWPERWERSGR
jgi:hypothetical protein